MKKKNYWVVFLDPISHKEVSKQQIKCYGPMEVLVEMANIAKNNNWVAGEYYEVY